MTMQQFLGKSVSFQTKQTPCKSVNKWLRNSGKCARNLHFRESRVKVYLVFCYSSSKRKSAVQMKYFKIMMSYASFMKNNV